MKIIHYSDAEPKHFDADAVKGVTGRVVIGKDDGANNFCMRFFEVAEGGYSPKHSHKWEHEIVIHSGKGEVLFLFPATRITRSETPVKIPWFLPV